MEESDKVDPDYLKGFNEGYALAQHVPDLADKLSRVKNESERGKGFQDGRRQYTHEQMKELRPSWLKDEPTAKVKPSPDKSPNRGRDLDK
jgi:hypothetical protein